MCKRIERRGAAASNVAHGVSREVEFVGEHQRVQRRVGCACKRGRQDARERLDPPTLAVGGPVLTAWQCEAIGYKGSFGRLVCAGGQCLRW